MQQHPPFGVKTISEGLVDQVVWQVTNGSERPVERQVALSLVSQNVQNRTHSETQSTAPALDDKVEFSLAGLRLAGIGTRHSDAIREEKVDRIRSELAQGTYDISGRLNVVLDAILSGTLV